MGAFAGQFKLLLSVLCCLKTQHSWLCLVDNHLAIFQNSVTVVSSLFFFDHAYLCVGVCVCMCVCHFTNPFTVILIGFKEGAEPGVRLGRKGNFEEVSFELKRSY